MKLRFCALLGIAGLIACSHSSETARDPSDVNAATASVPAPADPKLEPASMESTATPTPPATPVSTPPAMKATGPSKSSANTSTDATHAPLVGDPKPSPGPSDVAPDNTKKNERDRSSAALTPMDQNNNETDLKITQQIRQAVMADGSLSFTAKNVKIITQNGRVTLRGPVNTSQERDAIEKAARKVAGAVGVDNQIEVKK